MGRGALPIPEAHLIITGLVVDKKMLVFHR